MRDHADQKRAGDGSAGAPDAAERERRRDTRLDFFRGVGMFIILIAHTPANTWNKWIPARFGYSDATEIFVFCSGAASAIAFLKVFQMKGFWIGTSRVSYRIWQIYWCHIGVFMAVAATLVGVDVLMESGRTYENRLNLTPFFGNEGIESAPFAHDTGSQLFGLMTLSYVPNLFDILPMYMVILALMPVVVALSWIRPWVAMAFVVTLWAAASQPWLAIPDGAWGAVGLSSPGIFTGLNLPAEPYSERTWFFNPFAWSLIFFTGFAFAVGWLPRPPVTRPLIILAAVVAVLGVFLDPDGAFVREIRGTPLEGARPHLRAFWAETGPLHSKTFFGLFRFLHFLAIAYLAWVAAGEGGRRLPSAGMGGTVVTVIRRVGQQSLAVFVASLLIARLLGVWIIEAGRADNMVVMVAANLVGFALIIAVAYAARFYRRQPWR